MILEKPAFLLLLLTLPIIILIYKKSLRSRMAKESWVLVLRMLIIILLILALTKPQLKIPNNDVALMFVVDLSDSMGADTQGKIIEFINQVLVSKNEKDQVGAVVFGQSAQLEQRLTHNWEMQGFFTKVNGSYTNIAAGLDAALANKPDEGSYRVVLLSDGEANLADTMQSAVSYYEQEIPIDVYIVEKEGTPEVYIEQVSVPNRVKLHQEFPLKVQINSSHLTCSQVRVYLNGVLTEEKSVGLASGINMIAFKQELETGGFYNYRVEVEAEADTLMINNWGTNFVIAAGLSPVLIVSDYESDLQYLVNALLINDIPVEERVFLAFPNSLQELQSYSAVVLCDIPAHYLSPGQIRLLHSYVHDLGGGLIVIGGEQSYGMGDYSSTQLDAMLPVNSQIEQRVLFPTLTMLLVIDKSGSMNQVQSEVRNLTKLDLAKEASAAVIDMLVSEERVGILAFDVKPEWIVPIQKASNTEQIKNQLALLEIGGGTKIFPALEEAYQAISKKGSAVRHILLLSDGVSEGDYDYKMLCQEMAQQGVTLSAVAIGSDADIQLMKNLAEWGKGEFYYTTDLNTITQVFIAETKRIMRRAISEETFMPTALGQTPLNQILNWQQVPPIHGFIVTSARELADVHLITPDLSPLLASWRYGLGRTVSFLGDSGEKWLVDWIGTEAYNRLFSEMVRYAGRDVSNANLFAYGIQDHDQGRIIVDALDDQGHYLNFLSLYATVTSPKGNTEKIELKQTAPGEYRGEFNIDSEGTFLINVGDYNSEAYNYQTGLAVGYSPEYRFNNDGYKLMTHLAEFTEGRIITEPDQVLSDGSQVYHELYPVWTWLLLAAVILFIIDIAVRVVSWSLLSGFLDYIRRFAVIWVDLYLNN